MTKTITFVSQSVKDFVAQTAMSGGDKTKIDTKEEYSMLKDFLSNNKDLPKNEKHYVTNFVKKYEKNVAQAVILESRTSTLFNTNLQTAKDVKKEMLNNAKSVLEQEEGIKISKRKIRKYLGDNTINTDKKSILKLLGFVKESFAETKNTSF